MDMKGRCGSRTQTRRMISRSKVNGPENRRRPPFDYSLNYSDLNIRDRPELYRVGRGEQGVLLVEPYKSEILPYWSFRTPEQARRSAAKIRALFLKYRRAEDFVGMDMARKFLQMGYTRSRRYANHPSGRKYDQLGRLLPIQKDSKKARSAEIFFRAWKAVESDLSYRRLKYDWKRRFG